jgi:hypothetical protein
MFALVRLSGVEKRIDPLQQLGCLLACLCHDLEHPGVNNNFLARLSLSLSLSLALSLLDTDTDTDTDTDGKQG